MSLLAPAPPRPAAAAWRPRRPEATVLYRTVAGHLADFLAAAEPADGRPGLPGFVRREFEAYLACGLLAHGFLRVRCGACREDVLVAFSCKGRGICPSYGGRRMADAAAHLVERVLPPVPVRQWVLTLPFRMRFVLAFDRELCRAVRAVFLDTLLGALRRREVLRCPACGGRRRIVAALTQAAGIRAILESLCLLADPPVVASARGPPELSWNGPAE